MRDLQATARILVFILVAMEGIKGLSNFGVYVCVCAYMHVVFAYTNDIYK
jgi:hypothetical protein